MWFESITALLSNHRHPENPTLPLALTRQQLVSLLRSTLNPNQAQDNLQAEVQRALAELQARGEVLAGTRNRYCIAPPIALAKDRGELTELLFQGDRSYLSLVHKALRTEQDINELRLRPRMHGFHRIQESLSQVGVCLLTVADSIQRLPYARKPTAAMLRSPLDNPFTLPATPQHVAINRYVPKREATQFNRWQPLADGQIGYRQLTDETLLRLSTDEYLWFKGGNFYELEPDTAVLAMFYQDKEAGFPLKLHWDEPQGRLSLQGVILPSAYAQWLWRLSEPDGDRYRTRYIRPVHRPLVKAAFERLGCLLV